MTELIAYVGYLAWEGVPALAFLMAFLTYPVIDRIAPDEMEGEPLTDEEGLKITFWIFTLVIMIFFGSRSLWFSHAGLEITEGSQVIAGALILLLLSFFASYQITRRV